MSLVFYFDCSNLLCLHGYQQAAGFRCPLTNIRAYLRTKRRLVLISERCESWKYKKNRDWYARQWEQYSNNPMKERMQSGLFSAIQLILFKTFWSFKRPRMSFSPHCFYDKSKMWFLVSILVYFILCYHFSRWGLGKAIRKYNKKTGLDVAMYFYSDSW